MNVLEKILEEKEMEVIKELIEENEKCCNQCEGACSSIKNGICNCDDGILVQAIQKIQDLLESKMHENDDWIPCSKRLPEDGTYLCTLDGELVGEEGPFTGMCGIENGKWDEEGCVIAWRPLPEPYRAADDSKADWKENMLNTFLAGH